MEITPFLKIAFLCYSEIVLSPLEMIRLLKIYVFASTEVVLSPVQCITAGIALAAMLAFKQIVSLQLLRSLFGHFEMRAQQHIEPY